MPWFDMRSKKSDVGIPENKTWRKRLESHRRFLICLSLFVLIAGCHKSILRVLASPLVADDAIGQVDDVLVLNGERYYVTVSQLLRKGKARQVLLLSGSRTLLVETGILLPEFEKARRAISQQGVSPDVIRVLPSETENLWDIADTLSNWLTANPKNSVAIVINRLESGKAQLVLQSALSPKQKARVRMIAIRDSRFDETNWWTSRLGIKAVLENYLRLLHNQLVGRSRTQKFRWNRETLEQLVVQRAQHS
jgi:hypothetical protein